MTGQAGGRASAADPSRDVRGTLVLIGGALDEDPGMLDRIVALALDSRADRHEGDERAEVDPAAPARIAILTTASEPARSESDLIGDAESDEADGRYYAELFARHGAVGVPIPVGSSPEPAFAGTTYSRSAAESEACAELVRACDAVFLGGGDQSFYLLALMRDDLDVAAAHAAGPGAVPLPGEGRTETPVMVAIRELLERGGPVAGTSAGLAIQQGEGMVTGGTSRAGWEAGAGTGYADDDALRLHPAGGFGFFDEGLLDSHFSEWGRLSRAPLLARAAGRRLMVGVDEGTALVYDRATRSGEVIGSAGVHLIDLAEAEWSEAPRAMIGAIWSRFTAGDRIDFARDRADRAHRAFLTPGDGPEPGPAERIWDEDRGTALLELALALLASPASTAIGDTGDPLAHSGRAEHPAGFRCTLIRDHRTTWTDAGGFSGLRVDITPKPTHE